MTPTTSKTSSPSPATPRKCGTCQKTKTIADFHRDSRSEDGYRRQCKECRALVGAARYAANADEIAERVRRYRREHGDHVRRLDRERYAANPEPKRAAASRWQHGNPEHGRDKHQRRRAAKGAVRLPRGYWAAILAHYGERCLSCGSGGPLTLDHVVPLANGGAHTLANCQPLCNSCNSAKGNRHRTDYRDPAIGILTGLTPEGPTIDFPTLPAG